MKQNEGKRIFSDVLSMIGIITIGLTVIHRCVRRAVPAFRLAGPAEKVVLELVYSIPFNGNKPVVIRYIGSNACSS